MAPRKKQTSDTGFSLNEKSNTVTDSQEKIEKNSHSVKTTEDKVSLEKSSQKLKESSPIIIIKTMNEHGEYITKQFTCSSLVVDEFKKTSFSNASRKTTNLDISINAQVIEVI